MPKHPNTLPPATDDEIYVVSLQYKISGFPKPSKANEEAYQQTIEEIASATQKLLQALVTNAEPRDREIEAAR